MKKGEKSTRTKHIERIAEYFMLEFKTVQNKLNEETKTSNLQIKKAYWSISNGLPYYDINELLRLLCIHLSDFDYLCRFTTCWSIDSDGGVKQSLVCVCNGKVYFSLCSGLDGINDILQRIGFSGRIQEPKNFNEILIWGYEI